MHIPTSLLERSFDNFDVSMPSPLVCYYILFIHLTVSFVTNFIYLILFVYSHLFVIYCSIMYKPSRIKTACVEAQVQSKEAAEKSTIKDIPSHTGITLLMIVILYSYFLIIMTNINHSLSIRK